MAIWYTFCYLLLFMPICVAIGHIDPILVYCVKKNLATLSGNSVGTGLGCPGGMA
jgi:hypothetical protein